MGKPKNNSKPKKTITTYMRQASQTVGKGMKWSLVPGSVLLNALATWRTTGEPYEFARQMGMKYLAFDFWKGEINTSQAVGGLGTLIGAAVATKVLSALGF